MQITRCTKCRRNDEMIDTLIAISFVSKRLARKLALLDTRACEMNDERRKATMSR